MTDIQRHAGGMRAALPEIPAMSGRVVNSDSGSHLAGGVTGFWAATPVGMGFAVERPSLPGLGNRMQARLPRGGHGPRKRPALAEGFCTVAGIAAHHVASRGGRDGSFGARPGVPRLGGLGPITHRICSQHEGAQVPAIVTRGAMRAGLTASVGR